MPRPHRILILAGVALDLALLCASAQAPPLACSIARSSGPRIEHGDFEMAVTNNYSFPATAYVLVDELSGPPGEYQGTVDKFPLEENAVPPDARNQPIGANHTAHIPLFTPAAEAYTCSAEATIYADGATNGDEALIGALLANRKQEEADHQYAIGQLTNLGAQPTPEALSQLASLCRQRTTMRQEETNRQYLSLPKAGDFPITFPDRIFLRLGGFLDNLAKRPGRDVGQKLREEIARQQAALSMIQASRPPVGN